jgi:hypothetical protein
MAITVFSPTYGDINIVPNWAVRAVPTSGTTGTLANIAQPGDLLTNVAAGPPATLYQNTGTSASPTWTQITVP